MIFLLKRNQVAREFGMGNKVVYAATNRTALRVEPGCVRLPFTVCVTTGRIHKSLYDLSLKTDFMRKQVPSYGGANLFRESDNSFLICHSLFFHYLIGTTLQYLIVPYRIDLILEEGFTVLKIKNSFSFNFAHSIFSPTSWCSIVFNEQRVKLGSLRGKQIASNVCKCRKLADCMVGLE